MAGKYEKSRGAPGNPDRMRAGGARVRVNIEQKFNYWGDPLPRPVAPRAIRAGLLRRALAADGFLSRALTRMTGAPVQPADLREAVFDHFQEGDFQLVFRVRARLRGGGAACRLAVLVSKGDAVSGRIASAEYRLLRIWARRAPARVAMPLAGEWIGSGGGGPRFFVYAAPWLASFHELGVTADLRFFINEHPIRRFPASRTDCIKARILALCLALYDPGGKRAIAPPLIGAGDIVIGAEEGRKGPALKLIAARGERRVAGIGECLRLYLDYAGEWGGRRFTLAPRSRTWLRAALIEGLVEAHGFGMDTVRRAVALRERRSGGGSADGCAGE